MFCNNCGNQITDGAKFCQKCGAKVKASSKSSFLWILLGMGIMLLLVFSIGIVIHFKGKTEEVEWMDSGNANEKISPKEDGFAFSGNSGSSNVQSSIIDAEGDGYLIININNYDYDLSREHTDIARSMLKDRMILYSVLTMGARAWNPDATGLTTIKNLNLRENNAADGLKDTFKNYAIIMRDATTAGAIRGGSREGETVFCYRYGFTSKMNKDWNLFPKGKLSFSTANGIREDSPWEEVLQINHGWESKGYLIIPENRVSVGAFFVPTAVIEQPMLQTYTLIYEDKIPVDAMAVQYKSELLQYEQDGKTIRDFLEDKELYSILSGMELMPELLEWECYLGTDSKYDLATLVRSLVLYESVMRFYNGEIEELAIVEYQVIGGHGEVSSMLPRNQLGVTVTVYSTEEIEKLD